MRANYFLLKNGFDVLKRKLEVTNIAFLVQYDGKSRFPVILYKGGNICD